jgi:hypothetical protein
MDAARIHITRTRPSLCHGEHPTGLDMKAAVGSACALLIVGGSFLVNASQPSKLLNSYPMIMAHDAASGEIDPDRDHVVMDWTRTQSVGLVGQLDCGARSFDYRPYLKDDVLFAHHGPVVVHKTMGSTLEEVKRWCNQNPTELVVLYVTDCDGDDGCLDKTKELLAQQDVYTVSECSSLANLTFAEAQQKGHLKAGGSLVSVLGCTTENYDPTLNCYGKGFVCYDSWPEGTTDKAWNPFKNYMSNTTASDPTAALPNLWMAQAHWQSDAWSVSAGTLHNSSILLDENRSGVNKWVEQSIRAGDWKYMNLLELDNVCDNGVNVLDALRQQYL